MAAINTDVIRTGAKLVHAITGRFLHRTDVENRPSVIFIHGFGSDGRYMLELAHYAKAEGFIPALFNYDSPRGIDSAAERLRERVVAVWPKNHEHGYGLVGHSMGGLVALEFATTCQSTCAQPRGIALVGAPNGGVPNRGGIYHPGLARAAAKLIASTLDWADGKTTANPYARGRNCRATHQLTGDDGGFFLESLWGRLESFQIPILSVSGGLPYLEIGKSLVFHLQQ